MPAAASVPAPQARKPLADADAWCDERTGDVFRKIGDGWHEISGEGEGEYVDETAYRLYWRGRLDRDKRNDMVFTTACTPVQCEYLFYVQCADGTFSRVFTTTATNMVIKPQRKTWAHVRYSAITDEVNGRYRKEWMTAALGVDLR